MPKRSDMKKTELLEECERLDGVIADLEGQLDAASEAASEVVKVPAESRLLPLVLHVGGVEWNGTQRKLVRCACSGEWGDKWLAVKGSRMFTLNGNSIPARPFHQVKSSLQPKVAWDFEAGLKFLTT